MGNVDVLYFASSMFLAGHDNCKCLMASEKYMVSKHVSFWKHITPSNLSEEIPLGLLFRLDTFF